MKLYELKRGDHFSITEVDVRVPPGEPSPPIDTIYKHEKIDGSYSRNYDTNGNVVYLAAWTEVEKA